MKRFRARIIQEFTIIAEDEERARYAALHRVARFADMGGIDEKSGKWKAQAHDPMLDSLTEDPAGSSGAEATIESADSSALPQGVLRGSLADRIRDDRFQLGFLSEQGYQAGGGDPPPDEVELEIF